VLHAARWRYRTQKIAKNSPSGHHRTTLSGYIFATEAHIDNLKTFIKQQYVPHMSPQYGELRPTSGWGRFVTARYSSSGRQPNFAALNRGRYLYSARWPSRWALAHISSLWSPYVIGRPYIFLPCSFFPSSFFFFFFFSSPNLSGRRSDVYHTSTHGVALVRI